MPKQDDKYYYIYVRDGKVNINFRIEFATLYLRTKTAHFQPVRIKDRLYNQVTMYVVTNDDPTVVTFADSILWEGSKPEQLEANKKYIFTLSAFTNVTPNVYVGNWSELNLATEEEDDMNVSITTQDSPAIDAFARLRVSNPTTLFDSKQIFDNAPLFWDDSEVSGGGTTSTHSTATASTVITVAASTAGRRIRQTFMRFNYQPGKSQLMFLTGTLGETGGGLGIQRCMGYYDDDNGILMRDNEGTVEVVCRSSASGAVIDTAVPQDSWNLDKLDGTGPSGVTLDGTKSQIVIIDLEWLGIGRVRLGFVFNGLPIYCHEFLNSNVKTGVYMSTPNLPLRYEIINDGTGAASDLEHICGTVISEGGTQDLGILRHQDATAITNLNTAGLYAILGMRLKATHLGATILIANVSMLSTTTNDICHWSLVLNPTIAGAFAYNPVNDSALEIAQGAKTNTVTNGIEIDGGYFTTSLPTSVTIPNALRLGSKIDGTPDEIVLMVRPITNNITVEASLTWREIS